jgi:hypothetical protein
MLMDILAGVVCGLLMGTLLLWLSVFIIWSKPDISERLRRYLPTGMPPNLLLLFLVIAIPPLSGVLGGIAGLLYRLFEDSLPGDGLGSSNLAFTSAVLILTTLLTLIVLILRRSITRLSLILNTTFAGIFGWILPFLADWR